PPKPVRELRHRRLAPKLVLHLLVDTQHGLMKLLQPSRKANGRALVPEIPLDLSGHGEGGEGRELVPEVWIEALDGLDQAEIADLHDVVERFAPVLKFPREEVDEVVVGVDQLRANAIALGRVRRFPLAAMARP